MFIYRMKGGTFCGSPFSCPLFMVQPSREAIRRQWAAALLSALFTWCTRVALAIRRCRAGGFRRLRTAGTVSKRIDTPYGGFYPLGTPSSALLGIPRSDGTQAFLLRGGTEKRRTAVPLPIRRPQSAIPFTATLKPLELCYTQLRKTRAICRDNAATMRKTEADTRSFMRVTYEVGP